MNCKRRAHFGTAPGAPDYRSGGVRGRVGQRRTIGSRALLLCGLALCCVCCQAQNLFNLTFRGTSYQTNQAGRIVATPITERAWVQQAAAYVGISDLSTLSVGYHINGSGLGDTIDLINARTGQTYTPIFGLFSGDFDNGQNLGRTALTNAPYTEVRRVDYIYGYGNNSFLSSFALGGSFTTKRMLHDPAGNLSFKTDGELEYLVQPQGSLPAQIVSGTFTTTKAFVPH